jgi:DNA-binding protein H-NS
MNRIRSSRRLEAESKRNLELLWLLRKLSPDHKTIANFRRDNPLALKNVFKDFVRLCVKMGLYGKELLALDGSKFKAVNSRERNFTKNKLKDRLKRIDTEIGEYLAVLEKTDREEEVVDRERTPQEIGKILNELKERKGRYQGYYEEMEKAGETQKSLTDSESRLMMSNGKTDVCYNVQSAVDAKHKLIAAFSVTNEANDLNQITPMACQVKEVLDIQRVELILDNGYDSAADIAASIQNGDQPHVAGTDYDICIPIEDGVQTEISSHKKGRCAYMGKKRNIALGPMGNVLYPKYYDEKKGAAVFYNRQACKQCSCRCTSMARGCKYSIQMAREDFSKEYDDKALVVRQVHIKPRKELYKQRKCIVEHPFGTIKRAMDSGYCLLKGKQKVSGEFSLIFLAYNLKRVINILGCKKLIAGMA